MLTENLTQEERLYNIGYLINLLSAAVNETQPPEPGEKINFEYVYRLAHMHNVANTAFYSVEKLSRKPEGELYKKWMNERNKCIHRNMIQTIEYNNIVSAFKSNKLQFLPIKGFPVCSLYPKPDYRYMGDIDILIKDEIQKAGVLIKNLGYMPLMIGKVHHDEYKKPPFMLVELHHEIISTSSPYYDYYRNIFDRCVSKDGIEYEMRDEDFYIFEIVHIYKHFTTSGTGIRSVMDEYLLNKKFLPKLNRDYIEKELKKLNLWDFNNMIISMANKWFADGNTEKLSQEELYIVSSGTYGNEKNNVLNRKGEKKGAEFLSYRFFPPMKWMKGHFPVLRKYPFLLPVMYVYRFFRAIFLKDKRAQIKREIEILKENK